MVPSPISSLKTALHQRFINQCVVAFKLHISKFSYFKLFNILDTSAFIEYNYLYKLYYFR